ncbi:hypothetical protein LSM04_005189 [Trypanosoma melophagium]|uniref:uncharacterized protein n=1 Tax=Trypanosoma melophagium TaxID=715481 RepID=UPI00351A7283|nr:hypothetical protein LSM04_005189 [Trypanosoma melophagium]
MIIRLIGDNWVPADKVLIRYKLYHTRDGRKCDYEQPINIEDTWKQLGLSSGGLVYLSKEEPLVVEKVLETVKRNETVQHEEDQHKGFTPETDSIDAVPTKAIQHIGKKKE